MKIIVASGGLGNMMFQYGLVAALRHQNKKAILFVSAGNAEHNGYELEKVFPNVNPYTGINPIMKLYYKWLGLLRCIKIGKRNIPHPLLFWPKRPVRTKEAIIYYPEVMEDKGRGEFLIGQFQSWKYYDGAEQQILKEFQYNEALLSAPTKQAREKMHGCNSVALHIRRGDYLGVYNIQGLGSICDKAYYERAIEYIKQHVENPYFFIFSDDKEYIKENYNLPNMTIVDFNKGNDSWQDMYLMSQCQHNIIANSTFSWWGAYLNPNPEKIVVAPTRWWAMLEKDDIIPPTWIRV